MTPIREQDKRREHLRPSIKSSGNRLPRNLYGPRNRYGVEEEIRTLATNRLADAALSKWSEEIVLLGYRTAVLGGWGAQKCVLSIGAEEGIHLMLGNRGSGPDTFCAVSEDFLDLEKDVITGALVAKDKDGKELRQRFPIDKHC